MADEGFQSTSFANASLELNSSRGDFEYGNDLASGIVFTADFHKFDDLKNQLDTNKDPLKLDAMRRIIEMVAKGKDCSELFPAVVKNVVSKDPEIKKLVYAYLTHYAEDQQDLALLSISTFQRALKDPNQLIRASALRVLSSIRIPMIVPIVMLAVQDASKDLSPYVRKTAAHAIIKVYSLDPEQKDILVDIIDHLLGDKTTLVVGSAVRAFEEICPDRLDLIHKHYRKLCSLLMDVDEWGQVTMISMLTRYARTQFMDPLRKHEPDLVNLSDSSSDDSNQKSNSLNLTSTEHGFGRPDGDDNQTNGKDTRNDSNQHQDLWLNSSEKSNPTQFDKSGNTEINPPYSMSEALPVLEADQNALLNACRFLLRSHNSSVVIAASQLLYYLNSKDDLPSVVKALIRTMHSSREIQYVILNNIATLTVEHRNLFEPYLHSFFIYLTDTIQVKLLKLEILSNLATESTSSIILREFQHYVNSPDPEFVTATIQAIGRCASSVPQIADICLNGLVRLMARPNERIMAECVVILRKLLQMQTADHKEIISHIAQLADTMKVPSALASILWLLGEYSHRVPRIAPDILRKMAKSFPQQETIVKFQIINLAAKLCIVNPRQTHTLAQYVLTLAKYDQNYDIRDKSRLLRALLFPQPLDDIVSNGDSKPNTAPSDNGSRKPQIGYLAKHARKICLATKPAPIIHSRFKDRSTFRLGSLSHILNRPVPGYKELPDWPLIPPDPWSRVVSIPNPTKDHSGSDSPSACSLRGGGLGGDTLGIENIKTNLPTSLQDFFSESDESEADESEPESLQGQGQGDISQAIEPDMDSDLEVVEDSSSESDFDVDIKNLAQIRAKALAAHQSLQRSTRQTKQPVPTDPSSTGAFLPSDSEETTFYSPILNTGGKNQQRKQQQKQQQHKTNEKELPPLHHHQTLESWLDENDSEAEVVSDVDKDEVLDVEESLGVEELDICSEHIAPNITVKGDTDNNMTTESRTSSTSVPLSGINSGLLSGDLSHTNSVTPVSSMLIESSLLPAALHTLPTPMPSFDHLPYPSINHSPEMGNTNVKPISFSVDFGRKSLPWTSICNPYGDHLELKWQFARTVWNHNPKLVILTFKLSNLNDSIEFHNIHLDLMGNAIGRLLLDASRVEPFKSISCLACQSNQEVALGIDFAGFTDPVELDLVYFKQTGSSNRIKWRLSITPSALELIRPVPLSEERYFQERRHFSGEMITHLHVKTSDSSKVLLSTSDLVEFMLEYANLSFLFAKLLPISCPSPCQFSGPDHCPNPLDWSSNNHALVTAYFAGRTISDNHLCLIECTHIPHPDHISSQLPGGIPDQKVIVPPTGLMLSMDLYCASSTFRSSMENDIHSLFKCQIS